ncbi:hypothetical protein [Bacillus sp. AFS073361]|nr:hypothetical protein [Bacillus sp. AFS073361]
MNKRKKEPIKAMATTIHDLLPAEVQTALYYLSIKTKNNNNKGDK